MPLYIAQSGDLDRCYRCLTDSQTLKDRATELFTKYKSGALVTQYNQKYTDIKLQDVQIENQSQSSTNLTRQVERCESTSVLHVQVGSLLAQQLQSETEAGS